MAYVIDKWQTILLEYYIVWRSLWIVIDRERIQLVEPSIRFQSILWSCFIFIPERCKIISRKMRNNE